MSFILGDADQFATLAEVLAFIDSSELGGTSGDSLLPNIRGGDTSPTDVAMVQRTVTKSKKSKRRNLSSSTRLQQCKKAEILYLRKRVVELEEELLILKSRSVSPFEQHDRRKPNTDEIVTTTWEELAEVNYQARLQAEEMNRTLRVFVADQLQSSGTLGALLQQLTTQEMDIGHSQGPTTSTLVRINSHLDDPRDTFEMNLAEFSKYPPPPRR